MKIKKINNIVIKAIKYDNENNLPVKGECLIDNPYANIFCLAKKRSGKTTVIYRMIQKCINKHTKVYIFCSTAMRDPAYQKMMRYFETHNIDYEIFTSICEDGVNMLSQIMGELNTAESDHESESESDNNEDIKKGIFDEECKPRKKAKPKYIVPRNLFIFDDLGAILKDKAIDQLLKTNRHTKSRVIISSQYLNDISIASRLQLDYIFMFKGLPSKKLEEAYRNLDLSINFEDFAYMYNVATNEKYHFLYVDIRNEKFRRDFNLELFPDIENNED